MGVPPFGDRFKCQNPASLLTSKEAERSSNLVLLVVGYEVDKSHLLVWNSEGTSPEFTEVGRYTSAAVTKIKHNSTKWLMSHISSDKRALAR